jgi:hypothetical protein
LVGCGSPAGFVVVGERDGLAAGEVVEELQPRGVGGACG